MFWRARRSFWRETWWWNAGTGGAGGGKFAPENEAHLVRTELLPKQWEFDPLAVKWLVQVAPPQLESGLSDLDRLTRAIQQQWGKRPVEYSLLGIRKVADALRAADGQATATIVRDSGRLHVINIEAGDTTPRHYALAIDVGTTTLAVQLINLAAAQIVAARSDYNEQIACGLDVISRINYARTPERLEELRRRVLGTINRLIRQVAKSHGVEPPEISNAAISGNTVMTHLLLGLNPEYLRLSPYAPTVLQVPYLRDSEIGIEINPQAWIHFSPCVGSYVGGDITAGILHRPGDRDGGDQSVDRRWHQRRGRRRQQEFFDGLRLFGRAGLRRGRDRLRDARRHRGHREGQHRGRQRDGPVFDGGQRAALRRLRLRHDRLGGRLVPDRLAGCGREIGARSPLPCHSCRRTSRQLHGGAGGRDRHAQGPGHHGERD